MSFQPSVLLTFGAGISPSRCDAGPKGQAHKGRYVTLTDCNLHLRRLGARTGGIRRGCVSTQKDSRTLCFGCMNIDGRKDYGTRPLCVCVVCRVKGPALYLLGAVYRAVQVWAGRV